MASKVWLCEISRTFNSLEVHFTSAMPAESLLAAMQFWREKENIPCSAWKELDPTPLGKAFGVPLFTRPNRFAESGFVYIRLRIYEVPILKELSDGI